MLILTRRRGEYIVINDNIEIVIMGINQGVVKLGINAPKDVSVHREEIYNLILKERSKNNARK